MFVIEFLNILSVCRIFIYVAYSQKKNTSKIDDCENSKEKNGYDRINETAPNYKTVEFLMHFISTQRLAKVYEKAEQKKMSEYEMDIQITLLELLV